MRRARTRLALLATPALLLTACDGGGEVVEATDPATTPDAQVATTAPGDDTASATSQTPADDASATTAPTTTPADGAAGTASPEDVEGGADGQAAADRAKAFLIALVSADEEACDMLLSFTDLERPMTDVPSDLELCQTQLPATMQATVEAQGLDEEGVAILETMRITGADVQGDTAVVDKDNYSPLFADAMGDSTITLKKIDGEWYVDIDAYLESP